MKIFTAPYILSLSGGLIKDGALVCEGGKIISVGKREALLKKYPDAALQEFPDCVLMPGLVNAHTHLDLLHLKTNPSADYFNWLMAGWDHRHRLSPVDRRQCLEEGIWQSLQAGVTTIGDVGTYVGVVPQVSTRPIRMVLFPELLYGGKDSAQEIYEGAFAQVDEIMSVQSGRLSAGIAPYAAYTLSRHLLKIISEQARLAKIPIKIHVAETFAEMQFFFESKGEVADVLFPRMGWAEELPPEHHKTPIEYLDSIGFLENAPALVGCNHLADRDLQTLAKRGAKVIHSPRSNAHLKLGHPPIKKLRDLGIAVALGTDGTSSLHSLSLWDEMRYIQEHYSKPDKFDAEELIEMATIEGARVLGLGKQVGSLEADKKADFLAIRIAEKMAPAEIPSWMVAHVTDREIAAVFVEGEQVRL